MTTCSRCPQSGDTRRHCYHRDMRWAARATWIPVLASLFMVTDASSHSWIISSVWGRLDTATLKCNKTRCRVSLKAERWMDVERGVRRTTAKLDDGKLDVWLEPKRLGDEALKNVHDIETWVKDAGNATVRLDGRVDNFDDDGALDLVASWLAKSPSQEFSKTPYPACGPPPWTPDHLAQCAKKARAPVKLTARIEAPAFTRTRRHAGTLALVSGTPTNGTTMYRSNPWALISRGALLRNGKKSVALTDLTPGTDVQAAGYFTLPRRVRRDGKLVFDCADAVCWPTMVLSAVVVTSAPKQAP